MRFQIFFPTSGIAKIPTALKVY